MSGRVKTWASGARSTSSSTISSPTRWGGPSSADERTSSGGSHRGGDAPARRRRSGRARLPRARGAARGQHGQDRAESGTGVVHREPRAGLQHARGVEPGWEARRRGDCGGEPGEPHHASGASQNARTGHLPREVAGALRGYPRDRGQLHVPRRPVDLLARTYCVFPWSSTILPARSTFMLKGEPAGLAERSFRIRSMLPGAPMGTPSTVRMMSPPTAICWPLMLAMVSPPSSPMFHAEEPLATVFTRKAGGSGTLKIAASSPVSMVPSMPLQNDAFSRSSFLAVLMVTTKPSPSLPPDFEILWLTMPITSPAMLNMGPPELPVLIVAVVWKNSARGMCLYTVLGGQRALIHPTLMECERP